MNIQLILLPLLLSFVFPLLAPSASATGPRVTTALFTPHANEIHTVDFPPYISTDVVDGGAVSEIIRTALKEAGIDAVISIHPLKRMVNYYLFQENALAGVGRHLHFSDVQKKELILIPLVVLQEQYFYYKPLHPQGLKLDADHLKQLVYGSHVDEDVSRYTAAGCAVKYGSTMSLFKQLKRGDVDFIEVTPLTVEWLLDRHMAADKAKFAHLPGAGDDEVLYMIFNRKHAGGEAAAARFKQALAGMVKDGTYGKILDKYLGAEHGKLYLRRLESFGSVPGL